ncbi:menaquinol oxidoreductase [Geobacter sp.]|uniref:menaquinol oxidoreductase n=1 Tax=Geobacter sp. TaxID=46610 RepID=UPI002614B172|nr:menaquinol oxidoreductase [Geobacter sp.]
MRHSQELTSPPEHPGTPPDRDVVRAETARRIAQLRSKSNRGLWAMALFIAISTVALRDFNLLPPLPETVRALLGRPPSALMISGALVLYTFSAIILILSRMMSGSGQFGVFSHVGYLSAFYAFYHFARALDENFWAVFAAGFTILALESYHIWNHYAEEIRKEQEVLDAIDRSRRS